MKKFTIPFLVALITSVMVLTGCSPALAPSSPVSVTAPSSPQTAVPAPEQPSEAPPTNSAVSSSNSTVKLLNELAVASPVAGGYNRDLFKHWVTNNNTNCDTRVAVLLRDAENGSITGCTVSGRWVSVYDGYTSTVAKDFDIDHMVPLSEAWVSGAYGWNDATREAYANDLTYPYSLIAVSASSNRSKSDNDPAAWMPPAMDGCEYVGRWVAVKYRWGLSVDNAEKDKILSVLSWCGGDYLLPVVPEKASVNFGETDQVPPVAPTSDSTTPETSETDPRFATCKEAVAHGYGPYSKGVNVEYEWYKDRDGDGTVCE